MEILRTTSLRTVSAPDDWFAGSVHIDELAAATGPSRLTAHRVHLAPGARSAWHVHPLGQTIYVLDGVGVVQKRGGPIELIGPGDRVVIAAGDDHWHGAAPSRFLTTIDLQDTDDQGRAAIWGEPVSDREYAQAPPVHM
jgi:quercetin dioxygenase-like cupin family protein